MRTQLFVGITSLLIWGAAAAQTNLPTVQVRADSRESVEVSCAKPDSVKSEDVERVLSVQDSRTTRGLRRKLISAVTDACKAGIPHILVTRNGNDLKWAKMD
jgi:hypothetical protein